MGYHTQHTNDAFSILLGTYNGAKYLEDFLSCLTLPPQADLLARDDGSSDDTIKIIENFAQKKSWKLKLFQGENLGPKDNFAYLLSQVENPYFFLADQDDIWESEKIPTLLSTMKELEKLHGANTPLLVYSDATLINAQGHITHPSFCATMHSKPEWSESFKHCLVMSNAAGCTMLGNRALAQRALPMPAEALMHDWWLLLVAHALGTVKAVPAPLVRYRQHEGNVLGASTLNFYAIWQKFLKGHKPKRDMIRRTQRQAAQLLERYGPYMPTEKETPCRAWAEATHHSWLKRRHIYFTHGFEKAGWLHNSVLWIYG